MANRQYTQVATRTGRKLGRISIPDTLEDYDNHHVTLTELDFDGETHYLLDGEPAPRPEQFSVIDRTEVTVFEREAATLSGLPLPCLVEMSGPNGYQRIPVDDGVLEIRFHVPGDYNISVTAFPFLPAEFNVHAV